MPSPIGTLIERIRELEGQLEAELAARRAELEYRIEKGRIVFDEEILRRHREFKTKLLPYILSGSLMVALTAPFIYAIIVPLVLLDAVVSLYQLVCFPVYGIPKVCRRDYFLWDRHRLTYLNALEKLNCAYCSYANGLLAYVREIASRTEQYWCPIKHAERFAGAHQRYHDFVDYGDAQAYRNDLETLRRRLAEEQQPPQT